MPLQGRIESEQWKLEESASAYDFDAVFTKHRDTSQCSWNFLSRLAKNYLKEEFSKLPGIGSLVSAFDKTMAETQTEIEKLHDDMKDDMASQFQVDFEFLEFDGSRYELGDGLAPTLVNESESESAHPKLAHNKEDSD